MRDSGLDNLLDLNGEIIVVDEHHFVKIEAALITVTQNRPHGIKYSLTLHDKHGERLLGFDNAHAVRQPIKGYRGKRYDYDHKLRNAMDKGIPYVFTSAADLMDDFWKAVYEYIGIE